MKKMYIVSLVLVLALSLSGVAQAGNIDTSGNVFVGIGNGLVEEYTPNGTPVQTLDTGTGSTYTTGMAFDSSGNLLVTDFNYGGAALIGANGVAINSTFISGQTSAESIAISSTGNIYVGDADLHVSGVNGSGVINMYSSAGGSVPTGTTSALTQDRGTDWIDLQADQKTILYTSEGNKILSVNTATNTQNADFTGSTTLPGSSAYALREIPTGTYAGDVLVADSSEAVLVAPGGTIVNTYILPENTGEDFALNLDPNGTDFWTADLGSNEVWEVNIATGAIDNQWNSNPSAYGGSIAAGLVVFGQLTASGGGGGGGGSTNVPEPGTLSLLAGGLFAIGGLTKLRQRLA